MRDISTFLNARAAYERELEDKNALLRSNQKIPSRSIRASIDPAVLEMLCELELNGINPNEVFDEELKNFLSSRAGFILRKGDATLISIFKEPAYDMKIADAADTVADFGRTGMR
jgi:hypothetical protein